MGLEVTHRHIEGKKIGKKKDVYTPKQIHRVRDKQSRIDGKRIDRERGIDRRSEELDGERAWHA